MELVGVTGTNGKTTIATLLYNTFRYFGYKVGLISTVCNYIDDRPVPTEHTTPTRLPLTCCWARWQTPGCKYAFMECSSHAIAQKRIGGLQFAGGLFTNLTRDHLDYHKTVRKLPKAKRSSSTTCLRTAFSHYQCRRQERTGHDPEHQGSRVNVFIEQHGRLQSQDSGVSLRRHVSGD